MGGIDKQHRAPASTRFVQTRLEFLFQEQGLLFHIGLGGNGTYFAVAQTEIVFKKRRTWVRPRRTPVCSSMTA